MNISSSLVMPPRRLHASQTDPGRALNRALFAGFNKMYDDISYARGMAVAREMQVQEL